MAMCFYNISYIVVVHFIVEGNNKTTKSLTNLDDIKLYRVHLITGGN